MSSCVFCAAKREQVIYRNDLCRVILVDSPYYPGYVQVVTNQHIKEVSDLSTAHALKIFALVLNLEQQIRQLYNPDKINIASLGNVVAHVHFHIIPRYAQDRHFPNPIWGEVTHADYLPSLALQQKNQQLLTLDLHSLT